MRKVKNIFKYKFAVFVLSDIILAIGSGRYHWIVILRI